MTIKISSLVDGPVKGKVTFDYLVWARESSGNPATYYLDVASGSCLAKGMTNYVENGRTAEGTRYSEGILGRMNGPCGGRTKCYLDFNLSPAL